MELTMAKLQIERRTVTHSSLSHDIARHLYARQWHGKAVVVCDNPKALTSSVMKQWVQLSNKVRRDRASTLNADKIREFSRTLSRMEHFRMTTKLPETTADYEVLFISPRDLELLPRSCRSIYVTCEQSQNVVQNIQALGDAEGLIVWY